MNNQKKAVSRRGFISTAATLAATAGVMTLGPAAAIAQKAEEQKKSEIIYRSLGRTGMKLPIVSMGAMNANNPEVVQASYELGVRHFDTAASYQYGRNEQMLGKVIGKLGVRDKVNIATKIFTSQQRDSFSGKAKKDGLIKAFEASLKRLRMDYVDILYIHSVSDADTDAYNNPYIIEALTLLKDQGKIKAHGISTHRGMAGVINDAIEKNFYDVVLTSMNVSLASNTALITAIENAAKKGIGIIAMKTQAGGSRLPNPQALQKYDSATINIASLKWVMQNKHITTSIPGYDNYDHMNQDFSVAMNLEFTDNEKTLLEDNEIKLGYGYCEQCDKCLATCPKDTDIPTLMRTYMYAAHYSNPIHARQTFNEIPSGQNMSACTDCASCIASCSNTIDIPQRIDELREIFV